MWPCKLYLLFEFVNTFFYKQKTHFSTPKKFLFTVERFMFFSGAWKKGLLNVPMELPLLYSLSLLTPSNLLRFHTYPRSCSWITMKNAQHFFVYLFAWPPFLLTSCRLRGPDANSGTPLDQQLPWLQWHNVNGFNIQSSCHGIYKCMIVVLPLNSRFTVHFATRPR